MSRSSELKLVFAGPMGAGKTTAIRAISDVPPVSTEVRNNDRTACAKDSTTAAMDYGQLRLEDGTPVRLYGTPGQARFAFMWDILCTGALGVILLLDGSSSTASTDLQEYARNFRRVAPDQPLVVGVGRLASSPDVELNSHADTLAKLGIVAPVYDVDVRKREDVLLLVGTLLCILEARIPDIADARR
jgi:signal recognition particle receptor subunit beta